jgi:anaerobic magnesium-protoporphyrin IX monomethyl ester cyclase
MEVLLVDPALRRGVPELYENLGVASLAATARRAGLRVGVLLNHVEGWSYRRLGRELRARRPDVIGVSLLSFNARRTLDLLRTLRREGLGSRIVVGGHFPTFNDVRLLQERPEVDVVVRGEGDLTFVDLLEAWRDGRDLDRVAGISYRRNGEVYINPLRPLLRDLDTLPWPSRDYTDRIVRAGGSVNLARSRGCFANCAFCSIGSFYRLQQGTAWRQRSIDDVLAELDLLARRWPGAEIKFYDDQFIGPGRRGREEALAFAETLAGSSLRVTFSIFARADTIDRELFMALKAAGLRSVFVGVESGSQRELDLFNKRTTVEDNLRALQVLHDLDIRFQMGLIFFDPYTNREDVQANMEFIERTRPYWSARGNILSVENRAIVYKGTPFWDRLQAEGRLKGDYIDCDYTVPDREVRALMKVSHFFLNVLLPLLSLARRLPDHLRLARLQLGDRLRRLVRIRPKYSQDPVSGKTG